MGVIDGMFTWGDTLESILIDWEHFGLFEYAFPFLLIFAIVFGILTTTGMFGENKGVNTVVALAIGLLAITSADLRTFFRIIIPYTGIGVMVLLTILILMGLFIDPKKPQGYKIAFFVIGGIIALIVVLSALSSYQWLGGDIWYQYSSAIIALLVVGGLVTLVILATRNKEDGIGPIWFKGGQNT